MRTIVIANQKGGVAKTTTAVNLAAELARHKQRVLVVDLDPQSTASNAIFGNIEFKPSGYDLLFGDVPAAQIVQKSPNFGVDVIPSNILLSGADLRLATVLGREKVLVKKLHGLKYDTCIIDSPPTLGLLSINALAAADEVLVPICPEYFSLNGIQLLEETIMNARVSLSIRVKLLGVVVTRYRQRVIMDSAVKAIHQHFGKKMFGAIIPENIVVEEAHNAHLPLWKYSPESKAAVAYAKLTKEVIQWQNKF